MQEILKYLNLKNLDDFHTTINNDVFSNIDVNIIRDCLIFHKMKDKNLEDNEESKFEHVNKILMLKYERLVKRHEDEFYKLSLIIE